MFACTSNNFCPPRIIMLTKSILGIFCMIYIKCSILPFGRLESGSENWNLESSQDMLQTGSHMANDYTQTNENEEQQFGREFYHRKSYNNMSPDHFDTIKDCNRGTHFLSNLKETPHTPQDNPLPMTQLPQYSGLEIPSVGCSRNTFHASNHLWDSPHMDSLTSWPMSQTTGNHGLQDKVPLQTRYPYGTVEQWNSYGGHQSGYQNSELSQMSSLASIFGYNGMVPNKMDAMPPDAHSFQQNCLLLGGQHFSNGQYNFQKNHELNVQQGTYGHGRLDTLQVLDWHHNSNSFLDDPPKSASIPGSSLNLEDYRERSIGVHVEIPGMESFEKFRQRWDSPLHLDIQLPPGPRTLSITGGAIEDSVQNHPSSSDLQGPDGSSIENSFPKSGIDSFDDLQRVVHSGTIKPTYGPQAIPVAGDAMDHSMLDQGSSVKLKGYHGSLIGSPVQPPEKARLDSFHLMRDSPLHSGNSNLAQEPTNLAVTGGAMERSLLHQNKRYDNQENFQNFEPDEFLGLEHFGKEQDDKTMDLGPTESISHRNQSKFNLGISETQETPTEQGLLVFDTLKVSPRGPKSVALRIVEKPDEDVERIPKRQRIQKTRKAVCSQAMAPNAPYSSENQARESETLHMPKGRKRSRAGGAKISPIEDPNHGKLLERIRQFGLLQIDSSNIKVDYYEWLSKLKGTMVAKFAGHPSDYYRRTSFTESLMSMVCKQVIEIFLGTVILTTHKDNDSSSSAPSASMLAGFNFIRDLFDEWSTLDVKTCLEMHSERRKYSYSDGTQPYVFLNHLSRLPSIPIMNLDKLWKLWLRWCRARSSSPPKFYAIQTHFAYELQKCMHQKTSTTTTAEESPDGKLWKFQKNPHPYKHLLLLQLHHFYIDPNFKLAIKRIEAPSECIGAEVPTLMRVVRCVGHVEVQLLEHHEAVGDWFDDLAHSLHSQWLSLELGTTSSQVQPLIRAINGAYLSILEGFMGILRIENFDKIPQNFEDLDHVMVKGWTFLKQNLERCFEVANEPQNKPQGCVESLGFMVH
ncbi:hypothetical protein CROQUDRAFT_708512 [Cronartium quercuum f. sp. fusiforme G11]|uniref:Uncharacterized protein n=1 Tax=Cronartium quercuum f. sp. fusiforme G11 TaxID=708437 RepID=A0A9P6TA15_9BASI|nr:hypothetical protein CROQUDRAFT_708512 [Cronartium quercuum f. sp. fusiforme G11]